MWVLYLQSRRSCSSPDGERRVDRQPGLTSDVEGIILPTSRLFTFTSSGRRDAGGTHYCAELHKWRWSLGRDKTARNVTTKLLTLSNEGCCSIVVRTTAWREDGDSQFEHVFGPMAVWLQQSPRRVVTVECSVSSAQTRRKYVEIHHSFSRVLLGEHLNCFLVNLFISSPNLYAGNICGVGKKELRVNIITCFEFTLPQSFDRV